MKISKKAIALILFLIFIITLTKDDTFLNDSFYQNIKEVKHPEKIDALINKNYKLSKDYIPCDLEILDLSYSNEGKYLRKEAKIQLEKLVQEAYALGYKIIVTSAYRDYHYQEKLYMNYVLEEGRIFADNCSARPGHSEHQTGLAIDIAGENGEYTDFASSKEFIWMKTHAHQYGFILRYPEGKEEITGFKYEPWHYRYVGKIASYLYENNLTLEEYTKKE